MSWTEVHENELAYPEQGKVFLVKNQQDEHVFERI